MSAQCPIGHASTRGYQKGCRCDQCRGAKRYADRRNRHKKVTGDPDLKSLRALHLPFAPLDQFVRAHLSATGSTTAGDTIASAAQAIGTTSRQYRRWLATNTISGDLADHVAIALGEHPATIWGDD